MVRRRATTAGIHSIASRAERSPSPISCGGTWQSTDAARAGARRQGHVRRFMPPERRDDPNIQDVHRLAQCAERPQVFGAAPHGVSAPPTARRARGITR